MLEQTNPILTLLQASSFTDMMGRISMLTTVFAHDQTVAQQVTDAQANVRQAQAVVEAKNQHLTDLMNQYEGQLQQLNSNESNQEALLVQVKLIAQQQQQSLQQQQAQLQIALGTAQEQAQAQSGSYQGAVGAYRYWAYKVQTDQATISDDTQKINQYQSALNSGGGAVFAQWPIQGVITQPFGPTPYWFEPPLCYQGTCYAHFHTGLDIAAAFDTPIEAPTSGVIIYAGWTDIGFGQMVEMQVTPDMVLLFGHSDTGMGLPVHVGEHVSPGQVLAYEGSTGNSTGPHLHFQVNIDGVPMDPCRSLPGPCPAWGG